MVYLTPTQFVDYTGNMPANSLVSLLEDVLSLKKIFGRKLRLDSIRKAINAVSPHHNDIVELLYVTKNDSIHRIRRIIHFAKQRKGYRAEYKILGSKEVVDAVQSAISAVDEDTSVQYEKHHGLTVQKGSEVYSRSRERDLDKLLQTF